MKPDVVTVISCPFALHCSSVEAYTVLAIVLLT